MGLPTSTGLANPALFGHTNLSEWQRLLDCYGLNGKKIELRTADGVGLGPLRLPTKTLLIVPSTLWEEVPDHVRIGRHWKCYV